MYFTHLLVCFMLFCLFLFWWGEGGGAADKNGAGQATGIQKTDTLIIM